MKVPPLLLIGVLTVPLLGAQTVGEKAPPIELEKVVQGPESISLESMKGEAVVLEFWATWCGPCISAIPHLNELADTLAGEPIRFLSVSDEGEEKVKFFLETKPMAGWVGLDLDGSVFKAYRAHSRPHMVLIDRQGVIRAVTHPAHITEQVLRDLIAGKTPSLPKKARAHSFYLEGPDPLFEVTVRPSSDEVGRMNAGQGLAACPSQGV